MRRPSIAQLPAELARAAQTVARTLAAAGHPSYVVGGAVRDLVLGERPLDVDLATPALPDELERLFESTHAVGKAFGTVVVHQDGVDVQVTTFREETGYDDARRPSHVRFGRSLEADAARRDFTCNALYLEPLRDELVDPTGGLADLAARRLRCVGEPAQRFAEDGLRLLRLARQAAAFALEVEPATRAGAANSLDALRGVSPERVLAELERMAAGPAPGRALALLHEIGALARLPGLEPLARAEGDDFLARVHAAAELGPRPGSAALLAALLRPRAEAQDGLAQAALEALRPARALAGTCARAWRLERELGACLAELARGSLRRSRWIRLGRDEAWDTARALWRAWRPVEGARELAELEARLGALAPGELHPTPWITSTELAESGIPRGPRWAELLREAEAQQLDGAFADAAAARAWLAERARSS